MSYLLHLEEAAEHSSAGITPYIVAAIVVSIFVLAGVVTHSFRDVAHRHNAPSGTQHGSEQSAHH